MALNSTHIISHGYVTWQAVLFGPAQPGPQVDPDLWVSWSRTVSPISLVVGSKSAGMMGMTWLCIAHHAAGHPGGHRDPKMDERGKIPMSKCVLSFCLYHVCQCPIGQSQLQGQPRVSVGGDYLRSWTREGNK